MTELISFGLQRSRSAWERALRGNASPDAPLPPLSRDQLLWHPAPGSHNVGRLLWHIADVEDYWLQAFIGQQEFVPRFGKRSLDDNENASIPEWADLLDYLAETRARTSEAVDNLASRLEEPRQFYGRPSTVGNVFVTMITHEATHAGQIAHIMGVIHRTGW